MFVAAIAHFFAFSHKPFIDRTADDPNCCRSFLSMWDVSDVKDDVIEHVKVVGKHLLVLIWAALSEKVPLNDSKCTDSDHPVHAQSIVWGFACHSYIL